MPELDKVQIEEDLLFAFASTIAAPPWHRLIHGGGDYLGLLLISAGAALAEEAKCSTVITLRIGT